MLLHPSPDRHGCVHACVRVCACVCVYMQMGVYMLCMCRLHQHRPMDAPAGTEPCNANGACEVSSNCTYGCTSCNTGFHGRYCQCADTLCNSLLGSNGLPCGGTFIVSMSFKTCLGAVCYQYEVEVIFNHSKPWNLEIQSSYAPPVVAFLVLRMSTLPTMSPFVIDWV